MQNLANRMPKQTPSIHLFTSLLFAFLGGWVGIALLQPTAKLLLVIPLILIAGVVILVDPERSLWLVMSYVIVDYVLRKFSALAFLSGSWDELSFMVITLLWIGKMAWQRKSKVNFTPLDWPLLTFITITIFLLLVRSPEMGIAIEGWRAVTEYVFWFFVVSNLVTNKNHVKILINLFLVIATLIALHGIYQYIIKVPIPAEWVDKAEKGIRTRVFSIIGSPNILGSLMVLSLPIALSNFLSARTLFKKAVMLAAAGAMGLCLIFTYSRGAWLAMLAGVVVFGILKDRRILVIILIGAIAAPVFVPSVSARISYMLSPQYIKSSEKGGRLVRWQKALDRVEQSPVIGVGLGRFGGAVAKNNDIPGTFYVDNYYLKTLTEMGALGLGAMLWLFLNCLRLGANVFRRTKDKYLHTLTAGILAGAIGVLIHNGVENIFEVPMMNTYFWMLMGILAAIWRFEIMDKPAAE